jgi:predicted dehydrogenase
MAWHPLRYALVGTGHRGVTMWGRDLLAGWGDGLRLVGLCDTNPLRAERARALIGTTAPLYGDLRALLTEVAPDLVIVATRDSEHDVAVIAALDAGVDVICEKPLATTAAKLRSILEAEARSGRRVDVGFNYRFAPTAARIKALLQAGTIGAVTSVDFHWYLDTRHGADYFRRWHASKAHSGSLFVHKATHHFDLLNWYLDSDPIEVKAFGDLLHHGRNGPFPGERCATCAHRPDCAYAFDLKADPLLDALYDEPAAADGYHRDACVFREDIDIFDTMTAVIRYANGAHVSYSLNAAMPIEGYAIAFNGHRGRIELRQYERQPWSTPPEDEILVLPSFGGAVERIRVPHAPGGHFGGDDRLRDMLFSPAMADPLGQRAGSRAGAMAVLCGLAALESAERGGAVLVGTAD